MSSWVNTKDGLPEVNREVLLYVFGRVHVAILQEFVDEFGTGYYFEDAYNDNLHWEFCEVTAWHPMITYTKE